MKQRMWCSFSADPAQQLSQAAGFSDTRAPAKSMFWFLKTDTMRAKSDWENQALGFQHPGGLQSLISFLFLTSATTSGKSPRVSCVVAGASANTKRDGTNVLSANNCRDI
jgi:hypothetical protein